MFGDRIDSFANELANTCSLLGRLAYIASHYDLYFDRYRHPFLSYGSATVDLRRAHERTFCDWLNQPSVKQVRDMEMFLSTAGIPKGKFIPDWLQYEYYRALVPTGVEEWRHRLFMSDMRISLNLIHRQSASNAKIANQLSGPVVNLVERAGVIAPQAAFAMVAKEFSMSPQRLDRLFRRQTGVRFHEYSFAQRMKQAALLLKANDTPVKQVAHAVGYSDISNFGNAFKRFFQCSPKCCRQPENLRVPVTVPHL